MAAAYRAESLGTPGGTDARGAVETRWGPDRLTIVADTSRQQNKHIRDALKVLTEGEFPEEWAALHEQLAALFLREVARLSSRLQHHQQHQQQQAPAREAQDRGRAADNAALHLGQILSPRAAPFLKQAGACAEARWRVQLAALHWAKIRWAMNAAWLSLNPRRVPYSIARFSILGKPASSKISYESKIAKFRDFLKSS